MPVNEIVALVAAALAVVLLVRWVRSRSSRAPDLTMHRFSRALDAIAPGGERPAADPDASDDDLSGHDEQGPPSNVRAGAGTDAASSEDRREG